MSKKSKRAGGVKRASMKKARRESNQKLYQTRAAQGNNTLSKRAKLNAKRGQNKLTTTPHAEFCGQLGCKRCTPILNSSAYAQPGSCFYGGRFEKGPKPYRTSKEKLTLTVQSAIHRQTEEKVRRQHRNKI